MARADPAAPGIADQPQFATRQDAEITSVDWFVEPCWKGERVLARYDDGLVHLTDKQGNPAGDELEEAATVLAQAIDAQQALIDGSWTAMPFVGEGSPARQWAKTVAKEQGAAVPPDPASLETRRAFMAWDLVELDGQSLHDIPYQERRRLLSSVVIENVRVRVSPAIRMPGRGWRDAWRADGFTHFVAKHANSRYHPGKTAPDWLQVSLESAKQPSIIGRVLGRRPRNLRHIDDEPA
jgi:bifunctional non-homologous end joining protein LigD